MLGCVIQILVEGNISFFTYVFFRQMFVSFSFNFYDKAFLAISVVAFFFIFIVTLVFYFIFNYQYGKKFSYFIYCFYRCFPSFVLLTFRNLVRGFLRGVIHSTLYSHYKTQTILICIVEVIVILLILWSEKKKKVFLTQSMFCLMLIYHFLFIVLNIVLYEEEKIKGIEELSEAAELLLVIQKFLVFAEVIVIILEFIVELMPNNFMRPENNDELDGPIEVELVSGS